MQHTAGLILADEIRQEGFHIYELLGQLNGAQSYNEYIERIDNLVVTLDPLLHKITHLKDILRYECVNVSKDAERWVNGVEDIFLEIKGSMEDRRASAVH